MLLVYIPVFLLLIGGALLRAADSSENDPRGEAVYVAFDREDEGTSLFRVIEEGSQLVGLGAVSGLTKQLVVAGGNVYWAVQDQHGARLYRSHSDALSIEEASLGLQSGEESLELATDGQVVYWVVRSQENTRVFTIDGSQDRASFVFAIANGNHRNIVVENGEAFWAVDIDLGNGAFRSDLIRMSWRVPPQPVLQLGNARAAALSVEQGYLWLLTTADPLGNPVARLYGAPVLHADLVLHAQVNGTAGQLSAKNGNAFWSADKPGESGSTVLHRTRFGASGSIQIAERSNANSSSITTVDSGGMWETRAKQDGSASFRSFGLKTQAGAWFHIPGLVISQPVAVGQDVWVLTQDGDAFDVRQFAGESLHIPPQPSVQLRFHWNTQASMHGGRWNPWFVAEDGLWAVDARGMARSFPGVAPGSMVALGPDETSSFYFAANDTSHGRALFSWDADHIRRVFPAGSPESDAAFPGDFLSWNGHLLFSRDGSVGREWDIHHALPLPSFSLPSHGKVGSPRHLKACITWAGGDEENQWTAVYDRRQNQILNLPVALPGETGGLLFEHNGTGYFSTQIDGTWALGFHRGDSAESYSALGVEWVEGDPQEFIRFGPWAVFHAALSNGRRGLFAANPDRHQIEFIDEAHSFGPIQTHEDILYFVAREEGGADALKFTGLIGRSPLVTFQEPGMQIEKLHAHGQALFALGNLAGEQRIAFRSSPGSPWQIDPLNDPRLLFSFGGELFAVTGHEMIGAPAEWSRIQIRQSNGWNIVDAQPLLEMDDFTPCMGRLFFSAANAEGGRMLHALRWLTIEGAGHFGLYTNGINPRGLSGRGSRLVYAANNDLFNRDVYEIVHDIGSPVLARQVSSFPLFGPEANPIIDGPRDIRISSNSMAQNLPVGVTVATVDAEDREGVGGVEFAGDESLSFWQISIFEVEGRDLKLRRPVGRQFGPYLDVYVRATNRLGIGTTSQPLRLTVRDNHAHWLESHFPDGLAAGDHEDPDGDSLTNFMERALGLNPQDSGGKNGPAGLPAAAIVGENGNASRAFRFTTPMALYPNVRYRVLASGDLHRWEEISLIFTNWDGGLEIHGPAETTVTIDESSDRMNFEIIDPELESPSRFFRLRVEQ